MCGVCHQQCSRFFNEAVADLQDSNAANGDDAANNPPGRHHVHRRLSSGLVVLFTLACTDSTTSPDSRSMALGGPTANSAGVIASASGSAHRIRPLPDGELWVLSFNANKRADGTVTGYAHIDRKDLNVAWDVEVTCLEVVGNTAWIGGIIRNARGGVPQNGTISYFYVIDHGEGDNASLDRASAVRLNDIDGEDLRFCSLRPLLLPASDIAHGNVQVR
jgi:hypothetical protein